MKHMLIFVVLVPFLVSGVLGQEKPEKREIVIIKEREYSDFLSIRVGTWFPRDKEKSFKFRDISIDNTKSEVDQSQAIGIDFHYRNRIGRPMFFDFSISGWYSSYTYRYKEVLEDPSLVQDADVWVVVAPVTLGVSISPLPDTPIQPYAMVGLGAYVGVTGENVLVGQASRHKENKNYITIGGFLGAGVDLFLSPGFAISLGGKYQMVSYKEPMFTQQKDFTGWQATIGVTTALN